MKNLKKLSSIEKFKIKNLEKLKGGANGITDGTNFKAAITPTTQTCTGGCTSNYTTSGTTVTQTGTRSYDV